MKATTKFIVFVIIAALLAFPLWGCSVDTALPIQQAGPPVVGTAIYTLQTGGTNTVILNVINQVPGARAFVSNDAVLFASPMFRGWGFACVKCDSLRDGAQLWNLITQGKGYWIDGDAFSREIVPALKQGGWTEVSGGKWAETTLKVSAASATVAQKARAVQAWLSNVLKGIASGAAGGTGLISIFVVPAGVFDAIPPELLGEPIKG